MKSWLLSLQLKLLYLIILSLSSSLQLGVAILKIGDFLSFQGKFVLSLFQQNSGLVSFIFVLFSEFKLLLQLLLALLQLLIKLCEPDQITHHSGLAVELLISGWALHHRYYVLLHDVRCHFRTDCVRVLLVNQVNSSVPSCIAHWSDNFALAHMWGGLLGIDVRELIIQNSCGAADRSISGLEVVSAWVRWSRPHFPMRQE